jgi:signal transduction histidine kinase/phage shock protein PspC (stress-responsive transcriptional regulator)
VGDGALLGGVCTGLARHLGWPVMVVRVAFVGLAIAQFLGVIAYAALWLLMPPEPPRTAPGLESASRAGLRSADAAARRRRVDWGMLLALVALGTGLLWIVQTSGLGVSQRVFWPVAFACAGAALVWRQADTSAQKRWRAEAGGKVWLAPLVASGGWPALVRLIVGLGLVGAAFGIVVAQHNQLNQLPEVMAMTVLALAGLAVVVAPWLYRSRSALNQARAEKVRADARADMAAHLHDSVLQTLAMIQRQSDDPKAVQQLARRQERELRGWLYADDVPEATLKAALTEAAAEVEDERGVPVELVMVGDCETSDAVRALVRAAREAMVNAAKHSGADKVDVYAEVDEAAVEVFVRDRGAGFDLDAVPADRLGVTGSILNRMARHGGRASIRSQPGDGTEVRLEITR